MQHSLLVNHLICRPSCVPGFHSYLTDSLTDWTFEMNVQKKRNPGKGNPIGQTFPSFDKYYLKIENIFTAKQFSDVDVWWQLCWQWLRASGSLKGTKFPRNPKSQVQGTTLHPCLPRSSQLFDSKLSFKWRTGWCHNLHILGGNAADIRRRLNCHFWDNIGLVGLGWTTGTGSSTRI